MILALCDLEDHCRRENAQWEEAGAERLEALNRTDEIMQAQERRAREAEHMAAERLEALNRAGEMIEVQERRIQALSDALSSAEDTLQRVKADADQGKLKIDQLNRENIIDFLRRRGLLAFQRT
jgi:hypothetical protein